MEQQKIVLSRLTSGYEFQALCNAILSFEDARVRTFSREGPDGGIDALSIDGSTVYQYKFHQIGGSFAMQRRNTKKSSLILVGRLVTLLSGIW